MVFNSIMHTSHVIQGITNAVKIYLKLKTMYKINDIYTELLCFDLLIRERKLYLSILYLWRGPNDSLAPLFPSWGGAIAPCPPPWLRPCSHMMFHKNSYIGFEPLKLPWI